MDRTDIVKFLNDKTVEDFSTDMLVEWEKKMESSRSRWKENHAAVEHTRQEIETAAGNLSDLEKVNQDIHEARLARKNAITQGKSLKGIEKKLNAHFAKARASEDEVELAKDTVEALSSKERVLLGTQREIEAEIEVLTEEIGIINICLAAKEYNKKAADLAPAVRTFNELLKAYPHKIRGVLPRPGDLCEKWEDTAGGSIPILRLQWPRVKGNSKFPVDAKMK